MQVKADQSQAISQGEDSGDEDEDDDAFHSSGRAFLQWKRKTVSGSCARMIMEGPRPYSWKGPRHFD